MSETAPTDNTGATATALAEPPVPPTTPPTAAASGTPEPRRKHTGVIIAIVASIVALVFVVAVVLIVRGSGSSDAARAAATAAAYESAMKKAGVTAAYPGAPVAVEDITPTGSHPFSATFSPAEVAALLNTFPYESDAAGIRILLQRVSVAIPEAGTAKLNASLTANGGTYSGSVTLPLSFSGGQLSSTGVTALSAEGIPGNDGQKAQVGGALVDYFNAYLAAAPGLTIESASIGADGVTVKGTAPDSLAFP